MRPSRRTLTVVAAVAGCFVLVMGVLLALGGGIGRHDDPLQTDALVAMNDQLRQSPGDAELRERIRETDLTLRTQFFQRQRAVDFGAWLLLIGSIVAVGAAKLAQPARRSTVQPSPPSSGELSRTAGRSRQAVAVVAVLIAAGGALLVVAIDAPTPWPTDDANSDAVSADLPETPIDPSVVAANWPAFRGPGGLGLAPDRQPPTQWDAAEGLNVLWATPIELPGHSSPVVLGDRIFVTVADKAKRAVLCFSLVDGKKLWETPVNLPESANAAPPQIMEDTGYAAPSPATDGYRVYAIFANGDLVALDFDGNKVWHKAYGTPSDMYGHSTSLICHRNRVIVQMDQADEDRADTLTCFDGPTGNVVWEAQRTIIGSWASLCLAEAAGRQQLITIADPWAIAYDPSDGTELWRCKGFHGDVASSPTLAGDLALLIAPSEQLLAVRADASGEVTDAQIAWRAEQQVPDVTSPVADEQHVYTLTTFGELVARRLGDGETVWQREIDADFRASPVLAGGHLYLFDNKGRGYVIDPADGRGIGGGPTGAPIAATPAFVDQRIIVRTERNLICIGAGER
jgi:outer membrane protein assembly factor BamB